MHSSISILRGQENKQSRWRNLERSATDTDADSRGDQIQTSVKIRTAALAGMKEKKIGVEYAKGAPENQRMTSTSLYGVTNSKHEVK